MKYEMFVKFVLSLLLLSVSGGCQDDRLRAARQEINRVQLALQDRLAAAFGEYIKAYQQVDIYKNQISVQ